MAGMRETGDYDCEFPSPSFSFHLFTTDGELGDFLLRAPSLWLSVLPAGKSIEGPPPQFVPLVCGRAQSLR